MIDNLTITIEDSGLKREDLNGFSFAKGYPIKSKIDSFELTVKYYYSQKTNKVKVEIRGSLRKWFFGEYSTEDLKPIEFKKAIKKIAKELKIHYEKFCKGTVTQCEIGLNVKTSIPPITLNSLIIAPEKCTTIACSKDGNIETITYRNNNYDITCYDKGKEIMEKSDKKSDQHNNIRNQMSQGIYYYRIEVMLKNKKTFEKVGLKGMNTIGALIDNFEELLYFWGETYLLFNMKKLITWKDKNVSKEKYPILLGVITLGLEEFTKEYCQHAVMKKDGTEKRNASKEKSIAKKRINDLVNTYLNVEDTTQDFHAELLTAINDLLLPN